MGEDFIFPLQGRRGSSPAVPGMRKDDLSQDKRWHAPPSQWGFEVLVVGHRVVSLKASAFGHLRVPGDSSHKKAGLEQ